MKKRLSSRGSLLFGLVILIPAIIFAQQARHGEDSANKTADRLAATRPASGPAAPATSAAIERDLSEALSVIQSNYVEGAKLDYEAVFKSSITGMLRVLDPHSNYLDHTELEEFRTEQRSEYTGIGAVIGDLHDGTEVNTYIRSTFQNAPAARAGLRFGDRIVSVDDESMKGKPYFEVRKHLLGPPGSVVKVTFERASTGQIETTKITRSAVPQPSIPEAYMIRPGVGYVALTGGFNLTTADEFRAALESLHGQGLNMLVLDLRGNRGGLLIQAVRVANTFLQHGQLIVKQQGRIRGSSETFVAENDSPDDVPLVVIVNHGTASASEIVAGALQDHDRALIVGETSFGKGLVQNPFMLEYDSALLLTIAKYYTPSGRLIQRDYSNAGFYDYSTLGGSLAEKRLDMPSQPVGPESRTDTGRAVYGGGGISPDETIKPRLVSPAEQRMLDPVFAFARELVGGRVRGFDSYAVTKPIDYGHDLKPDDFPITDSLFRQFRAFALSKPFYKLSGPQIDHERAFLERQLRFDLATASYGSIAALQVFNVDDPQISRAIDVLPRARELAQAAMRARNHS